MHTHIHDKFHMPVPSPTTTPEMAHNDNNLHHHDEIYVIEIPN